MTINKDLRVETIEDLAKELNVQPRYLDKMIESGTFYFNGFTNTWWARYELEEEDPQVEEDDLLY